MEDFYTGVVDISKYADEMLNWIFDHCYSEVEEAYALEVVGFSKHEAFEIMTDSYRADDVEEILNEVYGED